MTVARKQLKWQKALEDVARITDRLGMPVDAEIIETVAVLYLLGFTTTGSCGGHLDRINEGPFVMLRSLKAAELEKDLINIPNRDSQEYTKLKNRIASWNFNEQNYLFNLLKSFYLSHKPTSGRMLTLRTIGNSDIRLNCQGSELAHIETLQEKEHRLALNRAEMLAFTEWLKAYYFELPTIPRRDIQRNLLVAEPTEEFAKVIAETAHVLVRNIGVHINFVYEGFFDGANGGPYILFESPGAEKIRKMVAAAKGSMSDQRRNELYKKAMKYNVTDQQRLYDLLDKFYAQHDTNYEQMLIIQTVRFSNFRLRNQGAEAALVGNAKDRKRVHDANCEEMRVFAEYIKSLPSMEEG